MVKSKEFKEAEKRGRKRSSEKPKVKLDYERYCDGKEWYHCWMYKDDKFDYCISCGAIRFAHWTKDKNGNIVEFVIDRIDRKVD